MNKHIAKYGWPKMRQDGSVAELPVFTIRSDPSLGDIKSIDDVYKLKRGKEGTVSARCCCRICIIKLHQAHRRMLALQTTSSAPQVETEV